MRLDRKLMTFAVIMLAAAFVTGSAFAMGSPSADSKKGKEDKESCESCDKESESHEGGKGFGGYAKRADVIKKYDTDGDGELSEEEKKGAQTDWKAEKAKGGKGNSGKGFGPYTKRADVIKKFDADGDGELSEEEKENESLKNAWRAETGKKEHDDESCEHSH